MLTRKQTLINRMQAFEFDPTRTLNSCLKYWLLRTIDLYQKA